VQIDIDVELTMPQRPENEALFTLVCEMSTEDGTSLQRTHQPLMLTRRSLFVSLVRTLALLPLYVTGLISESEVLRARVVRNFQEMAEQPLAAVRISVEPALRPGAAPFIQSAAAHVHVNSGMLLPMSC
jgi:Putative adipose-regulatory protein (Seipin)